jgi:hypothetical protein
VAGTRSRREDLLRHGDGGQGFGPAGVEGQVGDGFDELNLDQPVVFSKLQVKGQLLGVAASDESRDGDEAPVRSRGASSASWMRWSEFRPPCATAA